MGALRAVGATISEFALRILRRRERRQFSCGECDRWEQCGLPPNRVCVIAAQAARRDGREPPLLW